jgi:hypothetical protein
MAVATMATPADAEDAEKYVNNLDATEANISGQKLEAHYFRRIDSDRSADEKTAGEITPPLLSEFQKPTSSVSICLSDDLPELHRASEPDLCEVELFGLPISATLDDLQSFLASFDM